MLMYGSVRGSRWLILPWLVATLLFIVAYCAGMVLSTILFGVNVLSLAFLAIAIIESCIALYLWLCVISLFQHLADRQTNTQVFNFVFWFGVDTDSLLKRIDLMVCFQNQFFRIGS